MHKIDTAANSYPSKDEGMVQDGQSFLRTPGLLGRQPWIGLLMVVLGGASFAVFVINLLTNGPIVQMDVSVANSVHALALQSPQFLRTLMIFGFYLGEHGTAAIGFLLAIYFAVKRFWPEFCMVAIAWPGEAVIWYFLSQNFGRHRPTFDVAIWHQMTSPGFPSGHSISAVMCYGLLAYLLVPKIHSHAGKVLCVLAALIVILFIGYSRIFVGDHYLSDVLGGLALGTAWIGLVVTLIEIIFKKRIYRHV